MISRHLTGYWLGRRRYAEVHALMQELFEARRKQTVGDTVLLLEHEPVVTLGRAAKLEHLLVSEDELKVQGVDLIDTGRGGDVTLHAPGQLVAYPVVDLAPDRQDVRKYVQGLTAAMSGLVEPLGLSTGSMAGKVGLWVDARNPGLWPGEAEAIEPVKIGAIGVKISRWITQHGFALNLTTDLSLFRLIVPCGIQEFGVASVESLTGKRPEVARVAQQALAGIAGSLGASHGELVDASGLSLEAVARRARRREGAAAPSLG